MSSRAIRNERWDTTLKTHKSVLIPKKRCWVQLNSQYGATHE